MSDGALSDVKVLDLTHYIAGPFCTKFLADFGADVIKIEPPGSGDGARHVGPFLHDDPHPEKSLLFYYLNTNKRSITLDLKTARGKIIFKELVKEADILVESFEPRVMPSLGLDYETLAAINPRLVMTSISSFGQTGPYRDYQGSEIIAYAMGGVMYFSGEIDKEPLKHGLSQAQYIGGFNGAASTMIALHHQRETGEGQQVDVSIMEAVNSELVMNVPHYTYMGTVQTRRPRAGDSYGGVAEAADGYVVAFSYGGNWKEFAEFMNAPQLDDPRFASNSGRSFYAEELDEVLLPLLRERKKFELLSEALAHRFLFGVAQTPEDLVKCPQLEARGYFTEIEHPVMGKVVCPGEIFKMRGTPWQLRRPAPLLGQHNQEVYCDRLGYSKDDLVRLREQRII